jgi:hypothetical protein
MAIAKPGKPPEAVTGIYTATMEARRPEARSKRVPGKRSSVPLPSQLAKRAVALGVPASKSDASLPLLTPSVCGNANESTKETAKDARECFAKGEIELAQRRLPEKNGNWGAAFALRCNFLRLCPEGI